MRIRSRLLALVFTILVPSIIGAGMGIYYVYNAQQQSYRQSIEDLANAMALLLDREMSARASTLHALSRSPTITDNNFPAFYRFAHEVASAWDTTIVISDLDGQQLMNTRAPYGTPGLPRMTPSLIARRQKEGPKAALVSDVYYAPLGKSHSFAVQVPIERDGRVLYYLAMGAFTKQLQQVFDQQKMPAGWVGTILDSQGAVAARSQNPAKFVGAVADAELRKKIAANRVGTNDGITLDGVPVTAFFSRAPVSGWTFVVSIPQSALSGPAREATVFVAGIALLLLGLGVAAAAYIARKTARPMEELRLAAAELGQGKTVARQSSGVMEIDAVSLEIARVSEQIRSARTELEHRVADAVTTAERSQKALLQSQKLEALGRLTGGIAHDFNNVMQTLSTGLQLILFSVAEPRLKQTAEACQRAVARAAELTRQLMAFGRVQDANLETVDLAERMKEVFPLLKGGLRSDIDLDFDIAPGVWPVTIDPTQFELAMLNVAINARDAMPTAGRLIIRIRNLSLQEARNELTAGDYVEISVIDSGQGMPLDVLNKALDPFFTTKPVGEGSGMGLPQAYGFAKQVGGTLAIDSRVGEGTAILFYLPRAASPVNLHSPASRRIASTGAKRSGKILFVEDDTLVAAVVVPALKSAGFDVQEARTGDEAYAILKQGGPFDVVFSDIVMPGKISGIDLAEWINGLPWKVRVVLATGYSERRINVPGVEIVAKPYDVQEVIELLSR
jgi:signal transduction histidine kinase/CheY-like chemotaxis protein